MSSLTGREQRLLAIGVLVLILAALWWGAVSPLLQGFAVRRQAREEATQEYARNVRLLAALPLGRARAQAARAASDSAAFAIPTATAAAATEVARARVVSAAVAEGGALKALRLQSSPPRRVRLQADLRIGFLGLTRMIRRLETDRPFATIDSLSITSVAAEDGSTAAPLQEIRLELTYAYR